MPAHNLSAQHESMGTHAGDDQTSNHAQLQFLFGQSLNILHHVTFTEHLSPPRAQRLRLGGPQVTCAVHHIIDLSQFSPLSPTFRPDICTGDGSGAAEGAVAACHVIQGGNGIGASSHLQMVQPAHVQNAP